MCVRISLCTTVVHNTAQSSFDYLPSYDVIYLRAHGRETKNKEKQNKNQLAPKKRSGQKSVKAVREEEVKLWV